MLATSVTAVTPSMSDPRCGMSLPVFSPVRKRLSIHWQVVHDAINRQSVIVRVIDAEADEPLLPGPGNVCRGDAGKTDRRLCEVHRRTTGQEEDKGNGTHKGRVCGD